MKIRKGFVSNSSSSSFILDYYSDKDKIITLEKVKELLNKLVEVEQIFNPKIKFEDIFNLKFDAESMCVGNKNDDIIERRTKWEDDFDTNDKTDFKKCEGKIIINSADDNSIPYWMKEFLEDKLNAKYWHWG